jgi:hypothetical protein
MSYDHYRLNYYLTTNGWIHEGAAPLPDLIAETWEIEVCQGSEFGKESRQRHRLQVNLALPEEQRAELHKKFPFPGRSPIADDVFRHLI